MCWRSERLAGDKTWKVLFNNMVVLSRAFWVQDDSECDCDDHTIFLNEHKTVSAKQTYSVVDMSVGVSPVELSRFYCWLTRPALRIWRRVIQKGGKGEARCWRRNFFANQGGM